MRLETIRRGRVPLGLALLLVSIWLGTGIRRAGDVDHSVVLDSPLGLLEPHKVEPGWQFVPYGLLRLSSYPTAIATYEFTVGAGDFRLVSREGIPLVVDGAVRYRVDEEHLLEVHRTLGADLERRHIADWVASDLRGVIGAADYADLSGARSEDLRIELGRSLTGHFRGRGLLLLSSEIHHVRLRVDGVASGEKPARIPGMKVLLVGLDGADWNILDPLIEAGQLPNLARLSAEGTRGRLRTITPTLSPVIWTSMATGVMPGRHGIVDFVASTGRDGEQVPVTSTLRKVKAIWNILSENGLRVGITGWWASYPAEKVNGFIVSDRVAYQLFRAPPIDDRPGQGKVYPPDIIADVALTTVHPASIDAAHLSRYVRGGSLSATSAGDDQRRIESFKTLLAAGDTYAAATVRLAERYAPDFTAFYLEGTDTVAHLFMPFAPPALEGTDSASRKRFGGVVDAYYGHADELLGELIATVKPTVVIICSDHGFRTGGNRPMTDSRIGYGPAADWHRKFGVIILHGEPFRAGHRMADVSVLDLTPTILALFGLPVGEDMDGRPMVEAFRPEFLAQHPLHYVPTYEGEAVVRFGAPGISSPAAETNRVAMPEGRGEAPPGEAVAGSRTPTAEAPSVDVVSASPVDSAEDVPPTDPAGDRAVIERLRSLGYLNQDSASSHNNRGLMHLGRGEYDAAIREFEAAARKSDDLAFARYNLARAHYKNQDHETAQRLLRALIEAGSGSKQAENLLGNIAMEQNRMSEAEAAFRRSLALDANFTDGHNSLGILLDRIGNRADALAEFRRVVQIDPDHAEGHNNIGMIHQKEGRFGEAMAAYRRAVSADPEFPGAYSNLAVLLELSGDLAGAEEQFRNALRRDPDNVKVRANYGGLLYQQGRLQEARVELEQAVESDPDDASARNNLGVVYGGLGRRDDERQAYRRAITLQPDYADAHHNLGLAFLRDGEREEGERILRRVLEMHVDYLPAYRTLAGLLMDAGQTAETVQLLSQAVATLPGNWELHGLLGESLLRQGETARAVAALQTALSLQPDQPELRDRLEALRELLVPQPTAATESVESGEETP